MQAIQGNVAFADRNDKTDMPILFCPHCRHFAQDDEKCSDGGIAAVAAVAQDADANCDWDGCWDWEDPYCHLVGTIIYTSARCCMAMGNHHL
jgi:hypothetical protein